MSILPALMLTASAATAPPPASRIEPLRQDAGDEGRHCTEDRRWCARLDGEGTILVSNDRLPARPARYPLASLPDADEEASAIWPHAIRVGDGVLMGVETSLSTGYSGGGGQATHLHLILFRPARPPVAVLRVPVKANILIRACFSEEDVKKRADACHDEYDFTGIVSLGGRMEAGMPVLHYRTRATSFPGPVSRNADSLERPPLAKSDLVTATDPKCSYARLFRFAPSLGAYRPEGAPLPDCSSYTVP